MVQILEENNPSFMQSIMGGFAGALPDAIKQYTDYNRQQQQNTQRNQSLNKLTGMDLSGLTPEMQQAYLVEQLKGKNKLAEYQTEQAQKLREAQVKGAQEDQQLAQLEKDRDLEPGTLKAYKGNVNLAEKTTKPRAALGGLSGQPVPKEISNKLDEVLSQNANANADQLALAFDKAEIPRGHSGSYIENRRRQDDIKSQNQIAQRKDIFQSDLKRDDKVKELADNIAVEIPQKETALNLMEEAIASKNLGFFSYDNLAELSRLEGLRSPEGAIFKTASKEYFLGNIARAGARPNQWIEQQIADMMAKVGRTTEANLSVTRALRNEQDLDKERVRLTEEIEDRMKQNDETGSLGREVQKGMTKYADEKQMELFNDLRAIKSIADGKPQKYKNVKRGTPISTYMAQAILKQFDKDPDKVEKAEKEAKKLGYSFEE